MAIYEYDTTTTTYSAALFLPSVAGLSIIGVSITTSGGVSGFEIPLHLTSYTGVARKATATNIGVLPIIDFDSNLSFGGSAVGAGGDTLPKIEIEGFVDTPTVSATETGTYAGTPVQIPAFSVGTITKTYAQLIAMYFEGRAVSGWARVNPTWFRDPYGRQFNSPRIIDFSATHIEGTPGRNNFTMQMVV